MRYLLMDIVWRLRWLYAIAGLLFSILATFALGLSEDPVLIVFGAAFFHTMAVVRLEVNGWTRVAKTLPVQRERVATAMWVWAVLVLPGVLTAATIVAMLVRAFVPLFLPGGLHDAAPLCFLQPPLLALLVASLAYLFLEFVAEFERRVVALSPWRQAAAWVAALASVLSALATPVLILLRVFIPGPAVGATYWVFSAGGALLVSVSFRYRRSIVTDTSYPRLPKTGRKPVARKSAKVPSYWWSAWRWHVTFACLAALVFLALLCLSSLPPVPWQVHAARGIRSLSQALSQALSQLPAFNMFWLGFMLPFLTAVASLWVFPFRVCRCLPIGSGCLVLRVITLPIAIHGAVLLLFLPDVLGVEPHALEAVMAVWFSFGMSLLLLAIISGDWGLLLLVCTPAACAGFFTLRASLWLIPVNLLVTTAGVLGLYAALTRRSNAYRRMRR